VSGQAPEQMPLSVAGLSDVGGDDLANHHRDGGRDNKPVRGRVVQWHGLQ
jgi:hypothetical protein